MKPQYNHNLLTSFYLWLDHEILSSAEAYTNITGGNFYDQQDNVLPSSFSCSASPYKQWVYDRSITGAVFPDTLNSANLGNINVTGDATIYADYNNGRFISTSGNLIGDTITSDYSVKDFNLYIINDSEKDIIFEDRTQINPHYKIKDESGISPYNYVFPACIINITDDENKPFCLGGMDQTEIKIRVIIMAGDDYHLEGLKSVFRDSARKVIPLVDFSKFPFNEFGDIKNNSFNYITDVAQNCISNIYVDKVLINKDIGTNQEKMNPNIRLAFAEFYLKDFRFPRI